MNLKPKHINNLTQSLTKHLSLLVVLAMSSACLIAQTQLERSVISSGGNESASSSIQLSSTIGELSVQTTSSMSLIFTQGFQQPVNGELVSPIQIVLSLTGASCQGRANGLAIIDSINGCQSPYEVIWSAISINLDTVPIDTMQVNSNTESVSLDSLAKGNYSIEVTSSDGCNNIFYFAIEYINPDECALTFYSGITPNDNRNSQWIIDNVELYPENEVSIFNRLGNKVWEGSNYDNTNVVWSGENLNDNELPSATYFYIFEATGVVEKGWIELTR